MMDKILKKQNLWFLLLIPLIILTIITSNSYINTVIINTKETTLEANNVNISNIAPVPKYETPKPEEKEEVKIPKIKIAPINDKEDSQKREHGNSKNTNVNDAKKYVTAGKSVGIDVSKYQGNIDWAKVKKAGVEFAIIRIGYRGNTYGNIVMDPYFYQNIKGAIANGIYVGIYFYSTALNENEAKEEAAWTVNIIKNYKITYPVAYDFEDFNRNRTINVSNDQLNKNAVTFLNYVKSKGYTPMHYGSKSKFGPVWNMSRLNNYYVWLAHYTVNGVASDYKGKYNMWQYSSKGSVNGISGYVDMNIAYFKFTSNPYDEATDDSEISKDHNQEAIDKVTFTEVNEKVKNIVDLELRKSPTTDLENITTTILPGNEFIRTGISTTGWSRVIYNETIYYVKSESLEKIEENLDP